MSHKMSHKTSLACAGAFAAAASLAGIGPAFSHTIVGNRVFPATLGIDDPGVNDELAIPSFAYVANPDNSNQFDYGFEYQKTITYDSSFSVGSALTHLVNTMRPNGNFGGVTGWQNVETQLKYVPYQNAEHEFLVAIAGSAEWGHTGNASVGAEPFTALTAKGFVGKGFGDAEAEWLRPIAVTGEIDYTWSTHPITFGFDPDAGVTIDRSPTVLTYGATLQYSLLYMNSFVHEVPEFFRNLILTFEAVFSTPVSNIGPSVPLSIPGTHETTGVYGPGLYYIGRLGPVTFQLGAVAAIPINRASGRHVGALAILDIFLDDTLPDSLGKPLFGPRQPRVGGLY
jgi:hypothetical protein